MDAHVRAQSAAERWSRTRGAVGEAAWRRLRAARVAVVGAGRNGSAAALALALLGVDGLVLIDPDRDEPHNRDATPLPPDPGGFGRPKVLNRREVLARLRPDGLEVEAIASSLLDPLAVERLRAVDLVVTAVDRDPPRLAAAILANRWAKPHLDIGSGVLRDGARRLAGADVRLCLPGEACLACLGGLRDPDGARHAVAAPPGALSRGPLVPWDLRRAGSLVTVNQVAVNLSVQLWLDLLAGRLQRSTWYHLRWGDDGVAALEARQGPEPTCRYCRPEV
jgi:hypothetical protein